MALSCRRISQAMLSKKVMLANAADARRNTSPQEALSHNSEWKTNYSNYVQNIVTNQNKADQTKPESGLLQVKRSRLHR